jgi:hypothetical protein
VLGGARPREKLDLTAKALVFTREIDGVAHYYGYVRSFYLPEETASDPTKQHYAGVDAPKGTSRDRRQRHRLPQIGDDVRDDARRFEVRVGYDPWNAQQLANELLEDGLPMVEVPQRTCSAPLGADEGARGARHRGRFHHDGNPVLTWAMSNVVVKRGPERQRLPAEGARRGEDRPGRRAHQTSSHRGTRCRDVDRPARSPHLRRARARRIRRSDALGTVYAHRRRRRAGRVRTSRRQAALIMGLFARLEHEATLSASVSWIDNPEFWSGNVGGSPTSTGIYLTPENSLEVSAVYACLKVISETIAMLPLVLYRRVSDSTKERATDQELYRLLRDQPNAWQTAFEFRETMQAWALLYGNAIALKQFDLFTGALTALHPIHPAYVRIEQLDTGRLRYWIRSAPARRNRTRRTKSSTFAGSRSIPSVASSSRGRRAKPSGSRAQWRCSPRSISRTTPRSASCSSIPGKLSDPARKHLEQSLREWLRRREQQASSEGRRGRHEDPPPREQREGRATHRGAAGAGD